MIKSPGVPGEAPPVARARQRGVPVWSELELGYRLLPGVELVAVTGTNGKTTTSELLGLMLGAPVAGNVGRALCELDGSLERRREGRLRGLVVPARGRARVPPARGRAAQPRAGPPRPPRQLRGLPRRQAAGLREPGRRRRRRSFRAASGRCRAQHGGWSSTSPIRSPPSRAFPASTTARTRPPPPPSARALGLGDAAIATALREFPGVPHRLELVRELDGVRFVNDSKATNVAAALRGLAAFPDPAPRDPRRLAQG